MQLSDSQINDFNHYGYLFFPELLDKTEISLLERAMPEILGREGPEVIREKKEPSVTRLAFGAHIYSEPFKRLSLLPRLLEPVQQLLNENVYIHQSRINPKPGFGGGTGWDWHQDYGGWHEGDGMPKPRCIMVGVFIDDCSIAKSPLLVVPKSHREGFLDSIQLHRDADGYSLYVLDRPTLEKITEEHGIEPLVGPAGSVCFCHSTLIHGSANNVSPWRRAIMYLIYNAVSNACTGTERPWYQNNRNFTPLKVISDDSLKELK